MLISYMVSISTEHVSASSVVSVPTVHS